MPVTKDNVEEVFTYHAPDAEQIEKLQAVRESAKGLANTILDNTPPCADQQAALRTLREAVMTANAAIALKGLVVLLLALALGTSTFAADCPCPPPAKSVKKWHPAPVAAVAVAPKPEEPAPPVVPPPPTIIEKTTKEIVYLPAPPVEPQGQWYLFPTILYEDRIGVGFGPGYKLKNGIILMGQVLYRDPQGGSSATSTQYGCRTFTCPGCSDQAGWGASFTVGVPLP